MNEMAGEQEVGARAMNGMSRSGVAARVALARRLVT